jgi:hypothetical protein
MWFYDRSSAANGLFINHAGSGNGGATIFADEATAGNATLICEGGSDSDTIQGFVAFFQRSNAGEAVIFANGASAPRRSVGGVSFTANSSAANATITANGGTVPGAKGGKISFWTDTPTAGNATLIANGGTNGGFGATIGFYYTSLGGTARVEVFDDARLDISEHAAGGVTIGSLEGNGEVLLGLIILRSALTI